MKKYIQLDYCKYIDENYTDYIKFLRTSNNLIEDIEEFYINILNGTQKEFNKELEKIMLNNDDLITDYELSEEDKKYILDYKEEFTQHFTTIKDIKKLCNELHIYFSYAGYTNYSYYVAPDYTYRSLASDLFNGYDFYDIDILDEKGLIIDSLSCCYITTDDELIDLLHDYFSIDEKDILLVENDAVKYFDFKKVKKQIKEYEFLEI